MPRTTKILVLLAPLVLLSLLLIALSTPSLTIITPAAAWNCQGHSLVVAIARRWLHQNFPRTDLSETFFASIVNKALKYDNNPFPPPPKNGYKTPLRSSISTMACLPDDMRSHPSFAAFNAAHHEDANCYPMNGSTCPKRFSRSVEDRVALKTGNDNTSKALREAHGDLVRLLSQIIDQMIQAAPTQAVQAGHPRAALNFAYLLHLVADAHQPLHGCSAYGDEFGKFYKNFTYSEEEPANDRGGNYWCLKGDKRKNDGNEDENKGSNYNKKRSSNSNSRRPRCGRHNLHAFYDKAAGYLKSSSILNEIVRGNSVECDGCDAVEIKIEAPDGSEQHEFTQTGDPECCLRSIAQQTIDYAMEHGSFVYFRQLKELSLDVASWVEDPRLCNATRRDKIRRPPTAAVAAASSSSSHSTEAAMSSISSEVGDGDYLGDDAKLTQWDDGAQLVPGQRLSDEYVAWAQDLLKKRLVLAGYRLGYVLKQIYMARRNAVVNDNNNKGRIEPPSADL